MYLHYIHGIACNCTLICIKYHTLYITSISKPLDLSCTTFFDNDFYPLMWSQITSTNHRLPSSIVYYSCSN